MPGTPSDPSSSSSPPSEPPPRRPGRPSSFGFCTVCGAQVPRTKAMRTLPGAFLCSNCAGDVRRHWKEGTDSPVPRPKTAARAARAGRESPGDPEMDEEGMVRKNLTITNEEDEFLLRHREINQSALFRHAINAMMQAEDEARHPRRRGGSASNGRD